MTLAVSLALHIDDCTMVVYGKLSSFRRLPVKFACSMPDVGRYSSLEIGGREKLKTRTENSISTETCQVSLFILLSVEIVLPVPDENQISGRLGLDRLGVIITC